MIELAGDGGDDLVVVGGNTSGPDSSDGSDKMKTAKTQKSAKENNKRMKSNQADGSIQVIMKGVLDVRGPGFGSNESLKHMDSLETLVASKSKHNDDSWKARPIGDQGSELSARLEFMATKKLNPEEVGVRFRNTTLIYEDRTTGRTVRQRLW